MRNLELTSPQMVGSDVGAWQRFLANNRYAPGRVDNNFGQHTHNATLVFQRNHHLVQDGVVGPTTRSTAQRFGFIAMPSAPSAQNPPRSNPPPNPAHPPSGGNGTVPSGSTTYPPRPTGLPSPSPTLSGRLFGTFRYVAAPTAQERRAIRITDGWDRQNIVLINVPQLRGVSIGGVRSRGNMSVHRLAANQIRRLFQAWDDAGLVHHIRTFSGAFSARFIGRSHTLSNHSWGAAFDINSEWNPQPGVPAATGRTGSVRELVPIANQLGFYWGGHYTNPSKVDGMHFELVALQ